MLERRLPMLGAGDVHDAELAAVLERAAQLSTPKPDWYLTLGHAPDMAVAYARFWDLTHRGGRVDHTIKELMRLTIATLLDCDFCAEQRSTLALDGGLDAAAAQACAMPDFDHPDPRTRAAVRFARAMAIDGPGSDAGWDAVYRELRAVFDDAEIVELGCFAAIAVGGVKLSRSFNAETS